MPEKKGKGGGGVGKGKFLYTFIEGKDVKDFRQEQWAEMDDVKGLINLYDKILGPSAETYFRLRLYELLQNKSEVAKLLEVSPKAIRLTIQKALKSFLHQK